MADTKETHADIIAEMRGARTEFPFVYLIGEPDTPEVIDFRTKEIIDPRKINIRRVTVKELADRLEVAIKRERGDAAKLREVCEKMLDLLTAEGFEDGGMSIELDEKQVIMWRTRFRAALAAPPRNCDVGTAAEQEVRFDGFCMAHKEISEQGLKVCSDNCPLVKKGFCDLHWAQMPYEEGGAK